MIKHNQKMEMIERVWSLDNKVKQLRSQIEVRGITVEENTILWEIEQGIKEVQLCLHESLPKKPNGYIWELNETNKTYTKTTKTKTG